MTSLSDNDTFQEHYFNVKLFVREILVTIPNLVPKKLVNPEKIE